MRNLFLNWLNSVKMQRNSQQSFEAKEKIRNILTSYCAHEEDGLLRNQEFKFTPGISDIPMEIPFGSQNKMVFTDVQCPGNY